MNCSSFEYAPWGKLEKRLESMCRKALFDFGLLSDSVRFAVALSGGKDSLTLLYLLKKIAGRGFPNWDIHAISIAGTFSCGPAVDQTTLLEEICFKMGVKLTVHSFPDEQATNNCYVCSRKRRTALFRLSRELGCDVIAFGHHRDDCIQTLLMNLFCRGEFEANLPRVHMHRYDITLIRPLFYISECDIIQFARRHHFLRTVCQCPKGAVSERAKVKRLLVEIEDEFPHVREHLAKAGLLYGSKKALNKPEKKS